MASATTGTQAVRDTVSLLSGIWCDILGRGALNPTDSLLDQGADSLAVARAVARVKAEMKVAITARAMFETPTLDALARRIVEGEFHAVPAGDSAVLPAHSTRPTSPQDWMLRFIKRAETNPPYGWVQICLEVPAHFSRATILDAVEALADLHDAFTFGYAETSDGWVATRGRPSVELTDLDIRTASVAGMRAALAEAVRADIDRTLPIAEPPPVVLRLAPATGGVRLLAMTCHHLAVDAWSFKRMAGDLAGLLAGHEPLSSSYQEFMDWQEFQRATGAHAEQLAWWASGLHDALPVVLDPETRDRHVPDVHGPAAVLGTDLSAHAEAVLALSNARRWTPFNTLLASFALALGRHVGRDDVVISVPTAGRPEARFENVVGYFANSMLLRIHLDPRERFVDIARAAQEVYLDGIEHPVPHWDEVSRESIGSEDLGLVKFEVDQVNDPSTVQHVPSRPLRLTSLAGPRPSRPDLAVTLSLRDGLHARVAHRPETVRGAIAQALTGRLGEVLERASREPTIRVGEL